MTEENNTNDDSNVEGNIDKLPLNDAGADDTNAAGSDSNVDDEKKEEDNNPAPSPTESPSESVADAADALPSSIDELKDDCSEGKVDDKIPLNTMESMSSASFNTNIDETPYEHGFEPGDHIIRWDMLPILWPIQIHGIVLEVSDDLTTVTICDFGITPVKEEKDDKKDAASKIISEKSEETILAEAIRKLDATLDRSSSSESEESEEDVEPPPYSPSLDDDESVGAKSKEEDETKLQSKFFSKKNNKRLNVITLTKWSDLRKWNKVNYNGGLVAGGVGKGLKSLGDKTGKLWTSMTKSFAKSGADVPSEHIGKDLNVVGGVEMAPLVKTEKDEEHVTQNNVHIDDPTEIAAQPNDTVEELARTESIDSPSELPSSRKDYEATKQETKNVAEPAASDENQADADMNESKTLAQMIAEANDIEIRSRKIIVKSPPSSPEKKPILEKKKSWHGSLMKSLSSILPQKDEKNSQSKSDSREEQNKEKASNLGQEPNTPDNLPKSDPPLLVLARTRFLLEQGEDVLPPYHIINSNSECIAVWCKTGRWSTLQATVYLHSTAIGNAKSTTALTLTVAATNPWLIPAMAGVGIAAVGTPWLFLKLANDKWSEATKSLTEQFWAQAEPEVFVECIEKWGRLKC